MVLPGRGEFGIHGVDNGGDALGHPAGSPKVRTASPACGQGIARRNVDFREAFAADPAVVNV